MIYIEMSSWTPVEWLYEWLKKWAEREKAWLPEDMQGYRRVIGELQAF